MTLTRFSCVYSRVFVVLFIWVAEQKAALQPNITVGYNGTDMMIAANAAGHFVFCHKYYLYYESNTVDHLSKTISHYCVEEFETAMESLNSTDWCIWSKVNSLYSNLSTCTEGICDCLWIPYPNAVVEQTFVSLHSKFFKDCASEELSDPPPAIVFALVITPICLIPVMVSLVVLKTKNGDGSS